MANKPITEDPDMDPIIRAVALFCAVTSDQSTSTTTNAYVERARVFEDYIRTGVAKTKDRN